MKVWVVKTSEMLASDNSNGRLLRSGLIAQLLDARGHDVTWWMSTFDHANRRNRAAASAEVPFATRSTIRMLHSPGYEASISLARLRDHAIWGRAFRRAISDMPSPDIIFCAYPTIEAAAACVEFGRRRGVPVVLDLRDMWPDIFAEFAPAPLRFLVRCALWPWHVRARAAMRDASALFAITEEFLSWGVRRAGRERRPFDGAFLLAYPTAPRVAQDTARTWLEGLGIGGDFNVAVIGSMTRRRFEMETVIAAARVLQDHGVPVRFILGGDGEDLPHYREMARGCSNVVFPGWLSMAQIRELLAHSQVGLVPYRNSQDLVMSIPNKVGEYLAAGLPVMTCLEGALPAFLTRHDCGRSFRASDPASLVSLLCELKGNEEHLRNLSANARRCYHEELVAETVYGRLIDRLEMISSRQARARELLPTRANRMGAT